MDLMSMLDRLDNAVAGRESLRTVSLHLEAMADTKEQKDAVQRLKFAGPDGDLRAIASAVRSAFLRGTIGEDGWPRK
jgi:hypothetical protein